MEGFYAMYYTGVSGVGNAVMIVDNGLVVGADVAGGLYNGSYWIDENGFLDFDIVMTVSAGSILVTGQTFPGPIELTIKSKLAPSFSNGQPVQIETSLGPINAIFKKIREVR